MNTVMKTILTVMPVFVLAGAKAPSVHEAGTSVGEPSKKTESQENLNQSSLVSIEKTWLEVPRICKAAFFNAQPLPLENDARSSAAQKIFAEFAV